MINMPCMEGQPEIVDDIENLALQNSFGRRKKNKTFRRLGYFPPSNSTNRRWRKPNHKISENCSNFVFEIKNNDNF